MKEMISQEILEKVNEVQDFATENGWKEEDLYYVAKVILSLFRES